MLSVTAKTTVKKSLLLSANGYPKPWQNRQKQKN